MKHLNNYITEALIKKHVSQNDLYVDLGLPSHTLWCTCNLGADKPEEFGNYYAWGETETKKTYTLDTYDEKYFKNKYRHGDNLTSEDDAAYVNTNGELIIPTIGDWQELLKNTTQKHIVINKVDCIQLTSTINEKIIIIPEGGLYEETLNLPPQYVSAYLSSTACAQTLFYKITISYHQLGSTNSCRQWGSMIRPIKNKMKK